MGMLDGPAQRIHHSLGERDCNNPKKVTTNKALTGRRAALVLGEGEDVDKRRPAPSLAGASH